MSAQPQAQNPDRNDDSPGGPDPEPVVVRADNPDPKPPSTDGRGEAPVDRFLRIASDPAPANPDYRPTPAAIKLADAFWSHGLDTFSELAAAAGVSRRTLYDLLLDRDAVRWIVAHGTRAAEAGLGLVHTRLLQLALTSRNPAAIQLYLNRFDPKFASSTQVAVSETRGSQTVALVKNMSDDELRAYLEQRRRQLLGANDATQ